MLGTSADSQALLVNRKLKWDRFASVTGTVTIVEGMPPQPTELYGLLGVVYVDVGIHAGPQPGATVADMLP